MKVNSWKVQFNFDDTDLNGDSKLILVTRFSSLTTINSELSIMLVKQLHVQTCTRWHTPVHIRTNPPGTSFMLTITDFKLNCKVEWYNDSKFNSDFAREMNFFMGFYGFYLFFNNFYEINETIVYIRSPIFVLKVLIDELSVRSKFENVCTVIQLKR